MPNDQATGELAPTLEEVREHLWREALGWRALFGRFTVNRLLLDTSQRLLGEEDRRLLAERDRIADARLALEGGEGHA